jgi:hypothetical protein
MGSGRGGRIKMKRERNRVVYREEAGGREERKRTTETKKKGR